MSEAAHNWPHHDEDGELEFAEAPEGLRNLVVVDPDSHRVGEVDGLVVDTMDHRTRMLVVGSGGILGLGRVRRLVPMEAVVDVSDHVHITTSHRDVHLADPYEPERTGSAAGGGHALLDLDEAELVLADPEEDLRGAEVVDRAGGSIGTVDGLLVDETERRVRFLQVGSGGLLGLGRKTRLIPTNAITAVEWHGVRVDTTVADVADSPAYDPDLEPAPDFGRYYEFYGLPAYWGVGYVHPMVLPSRRPGPGGGPGAPPT